MSDSHLPESPQLEDISAIVEPLLEASRTQIEGGGTSAPPPDNTTIAQVLSAITRPEVVRLLYARLNPDPLPDEPTMKLPVASFIQAPPPSTEAAPRPDALPERKAEPQEALRPLPIEETLSATLDAASLDSLLDEIRRYARRDFPQTSTDPEQERAEAIPPLPLPSKLGALVAQLEPPKSSLGTSGKIHPIPSDEDTRFSHIPRPSNLPELETNLVPRSLVEITQQLASVEIDEIDSLQAQIEADSDVQRLPHDILAHYALQLTQFSLEESSLGAFIAKDEEVLANAGDFSPSVWQTIVGLVAENWRNPGDAQTRIFYRRLEIGEVLLYSIQTLEGLTLTLIFSADMPLKTIRRQASRLTESLKNIPIPEESDFSLIHDTQPESEAVSDTEPHQPSDTKQLYTPESNEARESLPEFSIAPRQSSLEAQESSAAPPAVKRSTDVYSQYAALWLVEDKQDAISPDAAEMLHGWLLEICDAQGWRLEQNRFDPEWVYLEIALPLTTLATTAIETLMQETTQRAFELDPRQSRSSPWSSGYMIRSTPAQMNESDIQRFIRFYRGAQVQ